MRVSINHNDEDAVYLLGPAKIFVCHCNQCRHVKNKRKNRRVKAVIKRQLNKKRRKLTGIVINHFWS